ncbi:MAG: hypothetical protein PHV95_09065 [Eubacteriales bacterium]|nr:hypothetical protein [Eubacteriales bacterium]MDD4475917.1 hypothetical protein [Eubacteriales bacterium]
MKKELHERIKADVHESIKTIQENLVKIHAIRDDLTTGDVYEAIKEFGLSNEMARVIFNLGR